MEELGKEASMLGKQLEKGVVNIKALANFLAKVANNSPSKARKNHTALFDSHLAKLDTKTR